MIKTHRGNVPIHRKRGYYYVSHENYGDRSCRCNKVTRGSEVDIVRTEKKKKKYIYEISERTLSIVQQQRARVYYYYYFRPCRGIRFFRGPVTTRGCRVLRKQQKFTIINVSRGTIM